MIVTQDVISFSFQEEMKRLKTVILVIVLVWPMLTVAQEEKKEEENRGTVYGRIFSEFNTTLSGSENQTAFEVKRAYLGYLRKLDSGFSAEIKLDIGAPNDVSSYSLLRRFAYFRNAALYYDYKQLRLEFGLIETAQFKVPESAWGYRYIFKSFQDEYQFGPSADIGFKAVYTTQHFDFDGGFYNGEGYSNLQNDNTFKGALGVTARPFRGATLRIYGDLSSKSIIQKTYSLFAGYKFKGFSIGGEYNRLYNMDFQNQHDRYGFSLFGRADICKFLNLFGRFDKIESNVIDGAPLPWSLARDGSAAITGVEVKPIKGLRLSANYQDWYPAAKNIENESSFHFNVEISF